MILDGVKTSVTTNSDGSVVNNATGAVISGPKNTNFTTAPTFSKNGVPVDSKGKPLSSPAIINSKAATTNLNNIKNTVTDLNTGMQIQSAKNSADSAASDASQTEADKLKVEQDQKNKELAIKARALNNDEDGDTTSEYDTSQNEKELANVSEAFEAEAENVNKTIKNIQNGTVPLTPGEQAQIDGLTQQFNQLIDQQKLTNIQGSGEGNIRGYQTGSAEYDPSFQVKTIGSIVTAGLNKVADFNIQMAGAIAKMTQGFKENKISAIKDAWDIYSTALEKRQDTLTKTIERTTEAAKQAREDKAASEKAYYDDVTKPIQDLAKSAVGAPPDVVKKILASKSLSEAYENAGSYAAGGTGIVGEYNFYKSQAEQMGQQPLSFDAYQNRDANRKIKIAAAGNAAGLTTAAMNTALKLSDDYEARSKDFYSQRDAYNRVLSSASDPSPAGDLALIFNYMKVLDPNSTVREGEFATAQNSGSAFQIAGAKYNKIVNGERLTDDQRDDFVKRTTTLFNGAKTQQDSVKKEFETRATKYGVPGDLVTRDTEATGNSANDVVQDQVKAESSLTNYITNHPEKKAEINQKIKAIETSSGKTLTAIEFLQVYPEYQ